MGAPAISASGGPNDLGVMGLTGANYLTITAASLPNMSGSANYTIGMWIKTTETGAALLAKGNGAWGANDENFYLTSGVGNGTGGNGTHMGGVQYAGGWVGGNTAVNTGTWEFVSIVRSAGTSTVYVNGNPDGTSTAMANAEQGTQTIYLGYTMGDTLDGVANFNGSMSGVYVYNSALTQSQIVALMNAAGSPVGNLPATTAVSITAAGAGLDIDGGQQTIASLSGVAGANVYLGGGVLTLSGSGGSTTFAGSIATSAAPAAVPAAAWSRRGLDCRTWPAATVIRAARRSPAAHCSLATSMPWARAAWRPTGESSTWPA